MKPFAVIGHPIAHSRSPEIHQAFAKQTGIAITYRRLEAPAAADGSGFADAARAFFVTGGVGMNVTAPFKETAFRLASGVSERSRLATAANTLTTDGEGGWRADNTDGIGLVRDLTGRLGLSLTGKRLLILGAGGASAGILGPLLDARPSQIVLWNRSADKAQRLVHRFATAYPDATLLAVSTDIRAPGVFSCNPTTLSPISLPQAGEERSGERGNIYSEEIAKDQEAFDLVIHATSLKEGLSTDDEASAAWPWLDSLCASDTFFYDLSYADNEETFFLRWAKAHGACRWSDGFGMLIEQAAESFRIWHGCLPETALVFAVLRPKK
ncbi:MAG: shikimate dehydrogenase [Burkholderiales bacterium]|jgi:shikimate dehydrogenase|nr:shikimate dehydrogenase [Burkholderiales bacterium]